MSATRQIAPPNRLALFVNTPEGITLAEALAKADANLATMRPPGVEHVDALLTELNDRAAGKPDRDEIEQLYRTANELAGLAATFGLPALGRAAYSLCELLDGLCEGGCNTAAVQVHLEALRLLRGEDAGSISEVAAASVLKGLERVVRRLSKPPRTVAADAEG